MALGFRSRLLLGVGLAVALGALAQLGLGYLALTRAARAVAERELLLFAQSLYQALDLGGPLPALRAQGFALLAAFPGARARLSREGRVYLQYGGAFPEEGAWVRGAWALPEGYALEAALPAPSLGYALWASLLALPLALALALGVTFLLLRGLLRPLRALAQAAEALSRERFPEPVPLPPGQDELRTLAESFNRMVAAVRGFLERERLFTRHAAHELRTPVAALKGQLEAWEAGLMEAEEALPRLKAQLARLEGLLQGLLALARGEVAREPVALRPLLEELLRGRPGVRFSPGGVGVVLASPELLRQALENLLDNAFRHGRPPVEVELGEEGEGILLRVRDHGPGVPAALLPELGTPFRKGGPSRGLGLGLALVRQAVERLGGRVEWANAHPGLEVRIWLPKGEG